MPSKDYVRFGLSSDHPVRAVSTGQYRIPCTGEWYLYGAIPEARRMAGSYGQRAFWICDLVSVEIVNQVAHALPCALC